MPKRIFGAVWKALSWVGRLFKDPKVQEELKKIQEYVPHVTPVVDAVAKIVPDPKQATLDDIKGAYTAFGKTLGNIQLEPRQFGWALSELVISIVREKLNDYLTSSPIIRGAIELALVAIRAMK